MGISLNKVILILKYNNSILYKDKMKNLIIKLFVIMETLFLFKLKLIVVVSS